MDRQAVTASQLAAAGRHVVTFIAGGVTCLAALHVVSAGDAATIGSTLTRIGNDVVDICAALAPLAAIVSGWYATYKASKNQQIKSVNAIDGVKVTHENAPGDVVTSAPKI